MVCAVARGKGRGGVLYCSQRLPLRSAAQPSQCHFYHAKPSGVIGEQGHLAYLMFDKVVKISQNQRVQVEVQTQNKFLLKNY